MTQFGPVPREALEVKDEISETSNTREIATTWRLKTPMRFQATEQLRAMGDEGTFVLQQGEVIELQAGQLMRRSCVVEVLMPQGIAGVQPNLG